MGAVCTTSLSVSGPSVIVSADRRSDDAPPEGQPDIDDHEVQPDLEGDGDVASSGEANINDGGECLNKVVSSSPAKDDWHKDEEGLSGSTHAKVKCMRRYRIKVKGAACRGQACCGGTA